MDGGAWWAAVHGVAKSRTRLSDFTFTFHFHAWEKEMATHPRVLVWRIPGLGEPGGLPSMGSHRVGHDWSDLAAAAAADLTEQSRILNVLFLRVIERQLRNTCVCVCVCVCVFSFPIMSNSLQLHGLRIARLLLSVEIFRQEYWRGLPFSFSLGSSWPTKWTCFSCVSSIGRRFFTIGTTWGVRNSWEVCKNTCSWATSESDESEFWE